MKKITTGFLIFFLCLSAYPSIGQDYPAAEQRWQHEHHLMKTGRAKGKTSNKNAVRLRHDYKRVRQSEKWMLQNSWLSSGKNYSNLTKDDKMRIRYGKRNAHYLKPG